MDICFNALLERVFRTLPEFYCDTPILLRSWDEWGEGTPDDYVLRRVEVGHTGFFEIHYSHCSQLKDRPESYTIQWDLHPECGSRIVKKVSFIYLNGVKSILIEFTEDFPDNSDFWVGNSVAQHSSELGKTRTFKNPFQ